MKSTRRHELQHNTLDTELTKVVDWLKKYKAHMSWGILLVVIAVLGVFWWIRSSEAKIGEIRNLYMQSAVFPGTSQDQGDQVQELKRLSEQDENEYLAASSTLKLGELYLQKMSASSVEAESKDFADQAALQFNRVIKDFSQNAPMVGAAYCGLAKVAEGRGNLEEARDNYDKVLGMNQLTGYPVVQVAELGLQQLSQLKRPVYLSDVQPITAQPMGPINTVRDFLSAVAAGEDDKLSETTLQGAQPERIAAMVRKLKSDGKVQVDTSDVSDTSALVLTEILTEPNVKAGPIVFRLVVKDDQWQIASAAHQSAEEAEKEVAAFRKEFPDARTDVEPMVELDLGPDLTDTQPADGNEPVDANE
ncbi:MAG: tetratricopeptide repeat protein [Phycisphaerae bacterium]